MLKLNNKQIKIISREIYDEIKKKHDKKVSDEVNKKIDLFYKTEKGKLYKKYHEVFKVQSYEYNLHKAAGVKDYRDKSLYLLQKKIEDKLILSTIEAKDLANLISNIKSSLNIK